MPLGMLRPMTAVSVTAASRQPAIFALIVSGAAYLISLGFLMRQPGAELAEPLLLLATLGMLFPVLAWLCTRQRACPVLSRREGRGLPGLLAYLAVFAVAVLGWGFSALNSAVATEPGQSIAQLVLKLATMVLLPAWLFLRLRIGMRPTLRAPRLWVTALVMGMAYLALQAVFGRGLVTLGELAPTATTLAWAIPACWLWQTIEAGLCEEVLFRRLLQEKISLATGSQVAAVAWASLLFGLAHAPGLWMRGGHLMEGVAHATPTWAVAYSIVMIAPAGIAFGVLWARTRSLWLLVPLHGLVDLLPQLAPFIRTWTGVS
jgi:membrane protease YdiL (CAAX protease family)